MRLLRVPIIGVVHIVCKVLIYTLVTTSGYRRIIAGIGIPESHHQKHRFHRKSQ